MIFILVPSFYTLVNWQYISLYLNLLWFVLPHQYFITPHQNNWIKVPFGFEITTQIGLKLGHQRKQHTFGNRYPSTMVRFVFLLVPILLPPIYKTNTLIYPILDFIVTFLLLIYLVVLQKAANRSRHILFDCLTILKRNFLPVDCDVQFELFGDHIQKIGLEIEILKGIIMLNELFFEFFQATGALYSHI